MDIDLIDWLMLALVVMAIFDWTTVGVLLVASRRARRIGPPIHALESRGRTATAIAIGASLLALLTINRHTQIVPPDWALVILAVAALVPSGGNLLFLIDLLRDRF